MATIGYRAAVADAFGVKVTGVLAYLMWAFIHVAYLIGWGNRLGTLYTWARALVFTKNRGPPDHHLRAGARAGRAPPPAAAAADTPVIEQTTPSADGAAARRATARPSRCPPVGGRPAEEMVGILVSLGIVGAGAVAHDERERLGHGHSRGDAARPGPDVPRGEPVHARPRFPDEAASPLSGDAAAARASDQGRGSPGATRGGGRRRMRIRCARMNAYQPVRGPSTTSRPGTGPVRCASPHGRAPRRRPPRPPAPPHRSAATSAGGSTPGPARRSGCRRRPGRTGRRGRAARRRRRGRSARTGPRSRGCSASSGMSRRERGRAGTAFGSARAQRPASRARPPLLIPARGVPRSFPLLRPPVRPAHPRIIAGAGGGVRPSGSGR